MLGLGGFGGGDAEERVADLVAGGTELLQGQDGQQVALIIGEGICTTDHSNFDQRLACPQTARPTGIMVKLPHYKAQLESER